MKKSILAIFTFFSTVTAVYSQNGDIKGTPVVEIFADFHYDPISDTSTTGFGLNRAYFGYIYPVDKNFSASLIIDIGTPEDLAIGSKPRRYAHFREASISYATGKLSMTMGITGTRIFKFQQNFWGKRYLARPYQSINGYGYVADLGFLADYKINDIIELDFSLTNGKGYSNIQTDNSLKSSYGITITPDKKLAFRAYADFMMINGLWQSTLVGFAGYKNERFYIGAEASYKSNLDLLKGHHAWGVSSTGGVNLTTKLEFFTRYDYSTSLIVPGEETQWNLSRDGQFMINGFEYTFNNMVKVSLDNQAFFPADNSKSFSDLIFINALFKF